MIGVSQGYILAANLDHPYLMDIFQQAVADGFTNDGLEKALKKGRPQVRSEIARRARMPGRGDDPPFAPTFAAPTFA
jgi:hypothetical protein